MKDTTILEIIHKITSILNIQPTYTTDKTLPVCREPGILRGYRQPNKPWHYYLISSFQLHNDTVNIWTHFIGFLIVLYQMFCYGQELDFLNDKQLWPFAAFGTICCMVVGLSTFAHMFHSRSEIFHYTCFQLDYIGIGLYGHGIPMFVWYYSGDKMVYIFSGTFLMSFSAILGVITSLSCCLGKLAFGRKHPVARKMCHLVPCGLLACYGSIPFLARVYRYLCDPACSWNSFNHHTAYITTLLISMFFFSSHLPERRMPGTFDIIGTGHQIFHCFVNVTMVLQLRAAYIDYKTRPLEVLEHMKPDFLSTFGLLALMFSAGLFIICFLHGMVKKKILQDKLQQKRD